MTFRAVKLFYRKLLPVLINVWRTHAIITLFKVIECITLRVNLDVHFECHDVSVQILTNIALGGGIVSQVIYAHVRGQHR